MLVSCSLATNWPNGGTIVYLMFQIPSLRENFAPNSLGYTEPPSNLNNYQKHIGIYKQYDHHMAELNSLNLLA